MSFACCVSPQSHPEEGFRFLDLYIRRPFVKEYGYELMLGAGGFGEVHKIHRRIHPDLKYAVKVLDFRKPRTRLTAEVATKELSVVKELLGHKHRHVVRLVDVFENSDDAGMHRTWCAWKTLVNDTDGIQYT